ncbi:MAG TPA: hypothetical protein DCE55_29345 [Planctomycetaceae bacterium]|nr:hypothetical protein [Planctomycetaceae bacterium]|tara:strand:- start:7255 stop:7641 length:387 start_codon:yes stop_codon:yes gene_type:complete
MKLDSIGELFKKLANEAQTETKDRVKDEMSVLADQLDDIGSDVSSTLADAIRLAATTNRYVNLQVGSSVTHRENKQEFQIEVSIGDKVTATRNIGYAELLAYQSSNVDEDIDPETELPHGKEESEATR